MLTVDHWDEIQDLIQVHNRHLSGAVLAVTECPFCPPGLTLQQGADSTEIAHRYPAKRWKKQMALYSGQKIQVHSFRMSKSTMQCLHVKQGDFVPSCSKEMRSNMSILNGVNSSDYAFLLT